MNCTDNAMISCQKITHSHTGCTQKKEIGIGDKCTVSNVQKGYKTFLKTREAKM